MGELLVTGPDAPVFLNRMLTNDVAAVDPDQVIYTFLCNHDGGTLDDLLVYRIGHEEFLLVVNAVNTKPVLSFLQSQTAGYDVEVRDYSRSSRSWHSKAQPQPPSWPASFRMFCR